MRGMKAEARLIVDSNRSDSCALSIWWSAAHETLSTKFALTYRNEVIGATDAPIFALPSIMLYSEIATVRTETIINGKVLTKNGSDARLRCLSLSPFGNISRYSRILQRFILLQKHIRSNPWMLFYMY